jgi:hypothetical protein
VCLIQCGQQRIILYLPAKQVLFFLEWEREEGREGGREGGREIKKRDYMKRRRCVLERER